MAARNGWNISVSHTHGSHIEDSVTCSIFRIEPRPNEFGGIGVVVHHPDSGRSFDTSDGVNAAIAQAWQWLTDKGFRA